MAVIGSTGSGKTYAMARILDVRQYVTAVRTKSDSIDFPGYVRFTDPRKLARATDDHCILDVHRDFRAVKAAKIARFYDLALEQKGWTIYNDETFYIVERLKLGEQIEELQTQGRSLFLSIVCTMQRPVRATRFILSESSHVICFAIEGRDRKTLAESTSDDFAAAVATLQQYEFAWWHRPTRRIWIGKVQQLEDTA